MSYTGKNSKFESITGSGGYSGYDVSLYGNWQFDQNITAPNLTGINTGDQDLSPYQTIAAMPTLASGTYSPTCSAEANTATVTASQAQYMRVGNTITVSGRFTADPTLAATTTSFEMTLPITSGITSVENVAGVAFCGVVAGMGAEITGEVTNGTAKVTWKSSDITSETWAYTFTYLTV